MVQLRSTCLSSPGRPARACSHSDGGGTRVAGGRMKDFAGIMINHSAPSGCSKHIARQPQGHSPPFWYEERMAHVQSEKLVPLIPSSPYPGLRRAKRRPRAHF